jgi:uracil-DNA glycosylase family 4
MRGSQRQESSITGTQPRRRTGGVRRADISSQSRGKALFRGSSSRPPEVEIKEQADESEERSPNKNAARRLKQLASQIRVCTKCPLCQSRTIAVPGEGDPDAEFMIIGEGPGKDEDKTGHPFVGSAGRYLDHVLEGTGIQRSDFFITNIVKCRPPGNRTPKANEIETCITNYLMEQIELIDPHLVLLLGSVAVKTVLSRKSVEEVRGKVIEWEGRQYLATYHPAARFYREDLGAKIAADFALLKRELKRIQSR